MTKHETEVKKLEDLKSKPSTDKAMKESIDKRIAVLKGNKTVCK